MTVKSAKGFQENSNKYALRANAKNTLVSRIIETAIICIIMVPFATKYTTQVMEISGFFLQTPSCKNEKTTLITFSYVKTVSMWFCQCQFDRGLTYSSVSSSSPWSAMRATETTSSFLPVSKTRTPPALRERNEMPSTGTRIDWPFDVASMI